MVETHFTELGRLPHLWELLDRSSARIGLGLDEPIGIEVRDGEVIVGGRGSLWVLEPVRGARMELRRVRPGSSLTLP